MLRNQRFSTVIIEKKECPIPHYPSLFLTICSIHCCFAFLSSTIVSPSSHLSRVFSEGRGLALTEEAGTVGKALRWQPLTGMVFHWRGESITLHGEENTGAFLTAEAFTDQTQNTLFPVFRQRTICRASLAQDTRTSDCTSAPRAECDRSGQFEKPRTWVADGAD